MVPNDKLLYFEIACMTSDMYCHFTLHAYLKKHMYITGFLYFQVSFHPKDRSVVCIVGQGIFKVNTYQDINK